MNQQEYKNLDEKFLEKLSEELDKKGASCKLIQAQFNEKVIAVWDNETPAHMEIYTLYNDGNTARWQFAGFGQQ